MSSSMCDAYAMVLQIVQSRTLGVYCFVRINYIFKLAIFFAVFSMAKFTTLGTTGRLGPTSVGTHYQGQDHEGQVTVNKGVQLWKVPATGMYTIEAAGAAGGHDKFTSCK